MWVLLNCPEKPYQRILTEKESDFWIPFVCMRKYVAPENNQKKMRFFNRWLPAVDKVKSASNLFWALKWSAE